MAISASLQKALNSKGADRREYGFPTVNAVKSHIESKKGTFSKATYRMMNNGTRARPDYEYVAYFWDYPTSGT